MMKLSWKQLLQNILSTLAYDSDGSSLADTLRLNDLRSKSYIASSRKDVQNTSESNKYGRTSIGQRFRHKLICGLKILEYYMLITWQLEFP